MNFIVRRPWQLPEREYTPLEIFQNRRHRRREFLKALGAGAVATTGLSMLPGCSRPTDEEIEQAGAVGPLPPESASIYPARRNPAFQYGRPETPKRSAAEYTNFYEFSPYKTSWRYVDDFKSQPWKVEIGGLCSKPMTLDLDDVHRRFSFEERAYRLRCVETWAMCVPWTGFPLHELLRLVEPQPRARFVAFESFNRPDEAPGIRSSPYYPWPYSEALSMDEATNELTLLATGIYGEPLPKQHGAPIRLIVPWKYGFKSIKSITKVTLVESRPATFWNTVAPHEYGFEANVNPDVPHPRWSQRTEWMLGPDREEYATVIYNGYGEHVADLYRA